MEHGWFAYSRNPDQRVRDFFLPRRPGDPEIVVWETEEHAWIIDDIPGDKYVEIVGYSAAEVRSGMTLARAMGWIGPGAGVHFRRAERLTS